MTSRAAKPLAAAAVAQLESDGVTTLIGTVVNPAGLTHAKTVPLRRIGAFADPGLGASPVWHAFTIDQTGIVFGDALSVVGDQRIRVDLSAPRAQYGLAGVLEHEGFVRDVTDAATSSGVPIEQLHPEYGSNQFEISLPPMPPVAAADLLVLMRIIVGRVARRYGMRVSLSPVPFAGAVGNGAHQHISLRREDGPLFSDGSGARGMTTEGEHAVAGLVAGLPEAQGVLCGSILSGQRMLPGHWSGAYVCWGTENREAAVRFLQGGPANVHGGNVEVKVIDPSANPYLASAAILGLALDGIERELPLPAETSVDPATLTDGQRRDAGTVLLPATQRDAIAALEQSQTMRQILGEEIVGAVVGVRSYEQDNFGDLRAEDLADRFRLAWSV